MLRLSALLFLVYICLPYPLSRLSSITYLIVDNLDLAGHEPAALDLDLLGGVCLLLLVPGALGLGQLHALHVGAVPDGQAARFSGDVYSK